LNGYKQIDSDIREFFNFSERDDLGKKLFEIKVELETIDLLTKENEKIKSLLTDYQKKEK